MTNHGRVRSVIQPDTRVIDENSVWTAEDTASVTVTDEGGAHTEYEYTLKQYAKDEYIGVLDSQLTDTQLALCDVYELIAGR